MYPLYHFDGLNATLHRPTLEPVVSGDTIEGFRYYPEGSQTPHSCLYTLVRLVDLEDWNRDEPDYLTVVFRDGSAILLADMDVDRLALVDRNHRSGRACLAIQAKRLGRLYLPKAA